MWLFSRACVWLVAVAPCLAKLSRMVAVVSERTMTNESIPSTGLSLPFMFESQEFADAIDAGKELPVKVHAIALSVSDASITWEPNVPDEDKDYACFGVYITSVFYGDERPEHVYCSSSAPDDTTQAVVSPSSSPTAEADEPSNTQYREQDLFMSFDEFMGAADDGTPGLRCSFGAQRLGAFQYHTTYAVTAAQTGRP